MNKQKFMQLGTIICPSLDEIHDRILGNPPHTAIPDPLQFTGTEKLVDGVVPDLHELAGLIDS